MCCILWTKDINWTHIKCSKDVYGGVLFLVLLKVTLLHGCLLNVLCKFNLRPVS